MGTEAAIAVIESAVAFQGCEAEEWYWKDRDPEEGFGGGEFHCEFHGDNAVDQYFPWVELYDLEHDCVYIPADTGSLFNVSDWGEFV